MSDRCIQFKLERNYRGRDIKILSDSEAPIRALTSYSINSKIAWKCLTKLNNLGENNKVTLQWVPRHVGVEHVEAADDLARKGARPFLRTWRPNKPRRSLLWNNLLGLRKEKISVAILTPGLLTVFLTGHCRLNEQLRILGLEHSGRCRVYDE